MCTDDEKRYNIHQRYFFWRFLWYTTAIMNLLKYSFRYFSVLYVLWRLLMLRITMFYEIEKHIHIENVTNEFDLWCYWISHSITIGNNQVKNVYSEVCREENTMFETVSKRLPASEYQSEGPGDWCVWPKSQWLSSWSLI